MPGCLTVCLSSLPSWPGLRDPPGTRRKLRLRDVCSHPLLADKSTVHLPCSGVTSSPSALPGHGLGPTGQPPEPQISCSGQGEVPVPLPHSQPRTWGSRPPSQPCTRSRHYSLATQKKKGGKNSNIIRRYVQSLTAELTCIGINIVNYDILLQNL